MVGDPRCWPGIEDGSGRPEDLPLLSEIGDNILFKAFCALADGAVSPISSTLKHFRDEYEEHVRRAGARSPNPAPGGSARSAEVPIEPSAREPVPLSEILREPTESGRGRHSDDRRQGGDRPPGHAHHPGRGAARDRDPAVLRPPAARADRGVPAVLRRGRGSAQAVHVLHHDGRRRHGRAHPEQLGGGAAGPRWRTSSSCCSTTRSTARSATGAGSARSRTRRWSSVRGRAGTSSPSGCSQSPSRCRRWSPWTASDACSARGAPGSATRSPATGSSSSSPGAPASRWRSPRARTSARPSREHDPDLPGRRAHRDAVSLRGPPLRPVERRHGVLALCGRLQRPARHAARRGRAGAGPGQPRGERRLDLRQGPVRLPVRRRRRPPDHDAADPRAGAGARVVRRGAREDRGVVGGRRVAFLTGGRLHGRGLLRALEARPHRIRHERPRSPAALPRRPGRGSRGGRRDARHVPRHRAGPGHRAGGSGRRAGGPHPAPSDPQGHRSGSQGVRRPPPADAPVGRGRARACRPGQEASVLEDPAREATGARPSRGCGGRASRARGSRPWCWPGPAWPSILWGPTWRFGWPASSGRASPWSPGGRATVAHSGPACTPRCCPEAGGSPWPPSGRRSRRCGARSRTSSAGRNAREILRPARAAQMDVLYMVGVDPLRDFPDAKLARRALDNVPYKVGAGARARDPGAVRRRLAPGRRLYGEGRPPHRLGGAGPADPPRPAAAGLSRPDWEIFATLALAMGR